MSDENPDGNTNENPVETTNENQEVNTNVSENTNVGGNEHISVQKLESVETLREGFELTIKNIGPVLVNLILWVLTIWIPYINVGTTIGLFSGIVIKLSREEDISFTEIFDPKYRKYMGEYFLTLGLMIIGSYMGVAFLIIPGIIISIAWNFALILVVDKEKNPIESLTLSNNITYGYKGRIFLIYMILFSIFLVLIIILSRLGSDFAFLLIILAYIFVLLLSLGIQASMYKQLTRNV
jgi:hypothetical protein